MLNNHLKFAWRNLRKNKGYTLINVGGLALGMAVALVIGLWVNDELSHDNYFTHKDKIAQIYRSTTQNGNTNTNSFLPIPLAQTLRESYGDNFDNVVLSSWNVQQFLEYKETNIPRQGNFMQSEAPELLDLKIVKGERDGLREVNSIMLNESTAHALFGNEDPIGKVIRVQKTFDLMVTAVYQDIPFNTTFRDLTFIIPWKHYQANNEWVAGNVDSWGTNSFQLFVRIADKVSMTEVSKSIGDVILENNENFAASSPKIFLLPMQDWYLHGEFEQGVQVGGRITYVWLFGIIGVFVLLLACINFMNLSTARSEKRAKEVGIRKSIGSQRSQLIHQFLSESFLVSLLAFVLAIALVVMSLDGFNQIAQKEIEFPFLNIWFWIVSLLFILTTTLLAGSYPSLYLSSFHPVKVLKGTFKAGQNASIPRKILVVVQFTVSVAFIIGTIIVMKQINHAQNRPIGYDQDGLIQIPTFSPEFMGKTDLLRTEFINSRAVVNMGTSSAPTTDIWSVQSGYDWEGKPEGFQESLAWTAVSADYAETLKLNIVQGRNFSRDRATDSLAVLINEAAVEYMGFENPIGQLISDSDAEEPSPPLRIIGVVEDMVAQSPYQSVMQGMYVFDRFGIINYYYLRLNPDQSASKSLAAIERIFTRHFPTVPFQYQFVDDEYGNKFASEQRLGTLSGIFTVLAIIISCLGLFGLTSFVAEQRTKEIGVRKVLGATVFNMWNMLSKEFLKLVTISSLVAIPIAYNVMNDWLQEYQYRITLKWWIFGLAMLGALLLTLITVSFQAIRAAQQNPVKSLRME
ncbi:ABC transporter permease [Poritiphilus flavus]|uniref:FtsX-like permease family protein n=1 Tax=Poritiphilus flavus TaxID=2697053 RepID=A0A6L9EFQ3_9FLAO|nr:ABC transporter permease [Poritiphilus flavus]NAS13328.1 FtsX-like permease family protein [Poritiphilus flavus]